MNPKVGIHCITYNQEGFIAQTLESMLCQKTDFPIVIYVSDDCSTDGTAAIIERYAERYPDVVVPLRHAERKGVVHNFIDTAKALSTEYVAVCEGDDYWTDPYKLQKQVDALEAHPEAAVCFHPVTVHWEDGAFPDSEFPSPSYRFHKNVLELSDLLRRNFIQTNSVMYRWRYHAVPFEGFPDDILPCDWFLHLLHAQMGKILFLPDNMGVYRRHKGGLWYESMKTVRWFKSCGIQHYRFYEEAEKAFGADFSEEKKRMLLRCHAHAMAQHDDAWLADLRTGYPVEASEFRHLRWKFFLLSVAMPFIRGRRREYMHRQKGDYKELLRIFNG